jgi:Flp pilus assembly protein TadG
VTRKHYRSIRLACAAWNKFREERATQIAEFALSLPILVLFVIGIFDFTSAITLKQKLANAVREGARVAAADPANDLAEYPAGGLPASVSDSFQVVSNYLLSENVNQCGLATTKPTASGTLTWVSNALGCGGVGATLQLTINRGYVTQQTVSGATVNVVNTRVTIQYPYKWQYSGVAGLVGGKFIGSTSITTTATAFNEN